MAAACHRTSERPGGAPRGIPTPRGALRRSAPARPSALRSGRLAARRVICRRSERTERCAARRPGAAGCPRADRLTTRRRPPATVAGNDPKEQRGTSARRGALRTGQREPMAAACHRTSERPGRAPRGVPTPRGALRTDRLTARRRSPAGATVSDPKSHSVAPRRAEVPSEPVNANRWQPPGAATVSGPRRAGQAASRRGRCPASRSARPGDGRLPPRQGTAQRRAARQ